MGRGGYLGEFEQVVLLAVARLDDEAYGMRIREEIETRAGRRASIGAVYATLERLESKGCVSSYDGEASPVRGGRARRHFRLEPAGVEALRGARRQLDRMWDGVDLRRSPKASS